MDAYAEKKKKLNISVKTHWQGIFRHPKVFGETQKERRSKWEHLTSILLEQKKISGFSIQSKIAILKIWGEKPPNFYLPAIFYTLFQFLPCRAFFE